MKVEIVNIKDIAGLIGNKIIARIINRPATYIWFCNKVFENMS